MATEKRYIEVNALMEDRIWKCGGDPYDPYYMGYQDALDNVEVTIDNQPTADVVEIDVISKWLYQIAMNNVGSPSLLSASCIEIISRLGGLVEFARERKDNG